MSDYRTFLREDTRLLLLQLLAGMLNNRSTSSRLTDMHNEIAAALPRSAIKLELQWLAQNDLVDLVEADSVLMVTLKERGHDVANGLVRVDGVRRPIYGSGPA